MGCEKINSLLIVAARPRDPESVARAQRRACHPPTTDPEFPVSERHRRQFHAHPIKPGYERLNVKFTHFRPHTTTVQRRPRKLLGDPTALARGSLLRACNTWPQTFASPLHRRAVRGDRWRTRSLLGRNLHVDAIIAARNCSGFMLWCALRGIQSILMAPDSWHRRLAGTCGCCPCGRRELSHGHRIHRRHR